MLLIIDSNRGIYIPQEFAKRYEALPMSEHLKECFVTLLNGPDAEYYWECWEDVLSDFTVIIDGVKHVAEQMEGDVWLMTDEERAEIEWN